MVFLSQDIQTHQNSVFISLAVEVNDNAGGRGTVGTKQEYERILQREFNIIIVWLIPNSPETNMLD